MLTARHAISETGPSASPPPREAGVKSVINELEPHESPEVVPSLQGEGRVAGPGLDILQSSWAPATRALVGIGAAAAAGMAIAAYTKRQR